MSEPWYRISPDRLAFFTIYWANGARITLSYASVHYVASVKEETIVIHTGTFRVVAQIGPKSKPRKSEMKILTDALTGDTAASAGAKAGTKGQGGEVVKGSGPDAPAARQAEPIQTVGEFERHFRLMQVLGLYHLPDAQVDVQVKVRVKDGYDRFEVRELV